MKTLVLVLLLVSICATASGSSFRCSPCYQVRCPSPGYCPYGVVKNVCGCCDVCGKGPGEECDHKNKCGPNYYCQLYPISYGNGICRAIPQTLD
ncbi:single insulin-like growth factor-binding domain protein-1 [Penaeus japonicus]|uniref:single insulin-like growth factor-binding domain protein-1 n=1 Tax=Penaeus japonicus TaxID=27405 RepID=UPI001C7136D0|nr:single insulin-like growth factor-binding domain protein-1 [Penaeus japonicus]